MSRRLTDEQHNAWRYQRYGCRCEICTSARREQQHNYSVVARQRSRETLNTLKAKPCTDCGGIFPPECMDFDHKESKDFEIGRHYRKSLDKLLAEIEKCDLVCANCHRVRTSNRIHGVQR